MKSQKVFLVLIILFILFQISFGQEKHENLILFDSVTELNCESLLSILDSFSVATFKDPNSVGSIVIQGGANPVENKFYELFLQRYIQRFRHLNKNNFVIITAKSSDKIKIDFWISKNSTVKPDAVSEVFTYVLPAVDKPFLFVSDSVEVIKYEGKLTFFTDCRACCVEETNLSFLSNFLQANPYLYANIKIYNKTRRRYQQLKKLVQNTAIRDYKISLNRLKFSYGGTDEGIAQLPNNISTIEINFIPTK